MSSRAAILVATTDAIQTVGEGHPSRVIDIGGMSQSAVDALAAKIGGGGTGLLAVTHDGSLSGGGTQESPLKVVYGTAANTTAQGNDSRLSDARAPTTHAATHKTGGADALAPADIGALASTATAAAATKLATARTIWTNLASTETASFDGSANVSPGVTGVLPYTNGGSRVFAAAYIGSSGTLNTPYINIASVTRTGTGVYEVVFERSASYINTFVSPIGTSQSVVLSAKIGNASSSGVTVYCTTSTSTSVSAVDAAFFLITFLRS